MTGHDKDQVWRFKIIYKDDSETTVVFDNVKHVFMTSTILTIRQHTENYPRERVCWWKLERA